MAQQFSYMAKEWEKDYLGYPYANGQPPETDEAYLTGSNDPSSKIISNMLAQNASINQDDINYLSGFPEKTDGKSGLVSASVQGSGGGSSNATIKSLMDPWGNPFITLFDHDLDGNVEAPNDPFLDEYKGETWRNCEMVIISAGRDGLFNKKKDPIFKY